MRSASAGRMCGLWRRIRYEDKDSVSEGCFVYRADYPEPDRLYWHPSIHMPRQAARIFLRVTGVRVERLQDIDDDGVLSEGLEIGAPFDELWNRTVKPKDRPTYGWEAYAQQGKCRNHAAFSTLKTIKHPL